MERRRIAVAVVHRNKDDLSRLVDLVRAFPCLHLKGAFTHDVWSKSAHEWKIPRLKPSDFLIVDYLTALQTPKGSMLRRPERALIADISGRPFESRYHPPEPSGPQEDRQYSTDWRIVRRFTKHTNVWFASRDMWERSIRDFEKLLHRFIADGEMCMPLRIGIIGTGTFATSLARELFCKSWVDEFRLWGSHVTAEEKEYWRHHMTFSESMSELFEWRPDVVVVTRGPYHPSYNIKNRAEFTEKFMLPTWKLVSEVLESAQKQRYDGLLCMISNPPGPLLAAAETRFGFKPHQLTSISSDTWRAANRTMAALGKHNPEDHQKLMIDVLGEHGGRSIIHWNMQTSSAWPTLLDPLSSATRADVLARMRRAGIEIMQASEASGLEYFDAPRAVATELSAFAYPGRLPAFSWYTRLDARTQYALIKKKPVLPAYLMLPVSISIESMSVHLSSEFDFGALESDARTELASAVAEQHTMTERMLSLTTTT